MWQHAVDQIESIHAMMSNGHRSVRMERHTLVLWGLAGALLILTIRHVIPAELFAAPWQRILVNNALSIVVLVSVAIWDLRWTWRKREARDESLSFVQLQLTKVWWSVIGLIILINIGMSFFGGGYLFYPILLSLLGLAFYIHGLFSQQFLAGAGFAMMLLGLSGVVLQLPLFTQEWLAVMVLGVGLPALGWMIEQPSFNRGWRHRFLGLGMWLGVIVMPAMAADHLYQSASGPQLVPVMLSEYQRVGVTSDSQRVVRLPAGTTVPLEVKVAGNVLASGNTAVVPLKLSRAVDILLEGDQPTGLFRIEDGEWSDSRNGYRIRQFDIDTRLTPQEGPKVMLELFVSTEE